MSASDGGLGDGTLRPDPARGSVARVRDVAAGRGTDAVPAAPGRDAAPRPVFPAVEPTSAVHDAVEHLRERVAADPGLQPGPGEDLRAEVLPRRRADGSVELRRAYWSARRPDPSSATGLTARTLYLDGVTGHEGTYDFPDDPVMHWVAGEAGALRGHGDDARVEVLRYIPLRRVTFRLTGGVGLPRRVIAKTKSESGLVRAERALTAAHAAAVASGAEFGVPAPIGLDLPRRLLYVEELPGRPLDTQLDALGLDTAMRLLGELHHGVHALAVPGVGTWTAADWLAAAVGAASQVGMLVPSVVPELERVCARLAATVPDDARELAFCQGDFVPGQILSRRAGPLVGARPRRRPPRRPAQRGRLPLHRARTGAARAGGPGRARPRHLRGGVHGTVRSRAGPGPVDVVPRPSPSCATWRGAASRVARSPARPSGSSPRSPVRSTARPDERTGRVTRAG